MKQIENFFTDHDYAESTEVGYRYLLRSLDQFLQENNLDLAQADSQTIMDWLNANPQWGKNQRYKAYMASRAYLRYAYGDTHAALKLRMKRPKPTPQRTPNEKKISQILESFDLNTNIGVRNYALISLMLDTGLRKTETCNLQLEHVYLDTCSLYALIKGGSWGEGYYSKQTRVALLNWLDVREKIAQPETKTFFCSVGGLTPGKPLTSNGLGCIFKYMSKDLGFKISPHDLRRAMASIMTIKGAPSEMVRKAGRWNSLEMVKIYTQMVPQSAANPYLPMNLITTERIEKQIDESQLQPQCVEDWAIF